MEKISRDWEKECLISYDNISSITTGILVRLKQETLPSLSGLDMSSVKCNGTHNQVINAHQLGQEEFWQKFYFPTK